MSITAVIEQGIIKLPKDIPWKSGTVVRIEPVEEQAPTLFDTLKDFDGIANDLPADMAANLDHYLHGHPKR
jgi:predicted DNA-binding antitoxin AbrB/MazE fold protein